MLAMPGDRQDQYGGGGSGGGGGGSSGGGVGGGAGGGGGGAQEHGRFTELWDVGGIHNGPICPPDPAHQRAINLLPMHDGDEQLGGAGCSSRDKKRRAAAGKKPCDEEMGAPGTWGAEAARGQVSPGAQHEAGREPSGAKKARKKSKRVVQNKDDITIFPRRKAGQDKLGSNRPPIVISRTVLESYFNMPQQKVCEKLVRPPDMWAALRNTRAIARVAPSPSRRPCPSGSNGAPARTTRLLAPRACAPHTYTRATSQRF